MACVGLGGADRLVQNSPGQRAPLLTLLGNASQVAAEHADAVGQKRAVGWVGTAFYDGRVTAVARSFGHPPFAR
jgi:hypothetical protein